MFLSFEKRLRRGNGGVCTCNHNEGLTHQNCQLSNSTAIETVLPNDRMYGSTSALYQRSSSEMANMNPFSRDQLTVQSVRSTSNIPKLLTPLRSANSASLCSSSNNGPDMSSGQTTSCSSTPLLSTGFLRRQTSLGQLEGRTSAASSSTSSSRVQNSRHSDGPFGSFQQKIRSMLLSSKESTKSKDNQTNGVSPPNQSSNDNQIPQNTDNSENRETSHNLANNYSIRSANSQIIQMDNSVDEENDTFYIRDVCSKWFGQKQSAINQSFSSQMVSAVNKSSFSSDSPKLSHNMKSSLSEKVVQKDIICQNSHINSTYSDSICTEIPVNEWTLNQNYSDERQQTQTPLESDLNSGQHDTHVVVVSGLECDINRISALTVKSDLSSNDISVENNGMPFSGYGSQPINPQLSEIRDNIETVSSPDHNYKSSSDSGRGTIRGGTIQDGFKNNGSDGISPLDLTSLDSDHSTHGVSDNCLLNQNSRTVESNSESITKNETIEKMQRELQRILEDKRSSAQPNEIQIDDLGRNFQNRLSIVNESDSWTSNTPSQTPQPQQKATSVKYCVTPKGDSKYGTIGSNGANTSCKTYSSTKSKQSFTNETPINLHNKSKNSIEKQRLFEPRGQKTIQLPTTVPKRKGNERSAYTSNKGKVWSRVKSKDRFVHPIDCDILSTTTGRDTNYDDLSSEYSPNTSIYGTERDNNYGLKKQLQGLEDMYSEILGRLGARRKFDNHKNRRKVCRSTSSVISGRSSVTSRGTRDYYYRRNKQEFRHKYEESHSSRRIKRLESHVITLARSVGQLSTDMRSNQSLSEEMENLRQDVDLIRSQLLALKQNIGSNGFTHSSKTYHQSNGHISANGRRNHIISPNKVEKLKRFFGDEPPLLRQFLKKLGYEKYARNFESEKIGITELPYLTEERMQKLGIPLGPRMRIMQESHQQIPQHKTISHSNGDNYSIYAIV